MASIPHSLSELTRQALKQIGALHTVDQTQQTFGAQLQTDYPWGPFPEGHEPYYKVGSLQLPALAGDTVIVTLQCPLGYDGVISGFAVVFDGGGFTQGSGDIVWRINKDGSPLRFFENITSEIGTKYAPVVMDNLRIKSGDIITVTVNHIGNPALNGNTIATIKGYIYPIER